MFYFYCIIYGVLYSFASLISRRTGVTADLLISPKNTIAIKGEREVRLNCASNTKENLEWHLSQGDKPSITLARGKNVTRHYTSRAFIEQRNLASRGQYYNLCLKNVLSEDAGKYSCVETTFDGKRASAQLTILDKLPLCTQVHNVSTQCQHVLHCAVKYFGILTFSLEWSSHSHTPVYYYNHVEPINNVLVSRILVNYTDPFQSHDFLCSLKLYPNVTLEQSYSCIASIKGAEESPVQNISTPSSNCMHIDGSCRNYRWIDENTNIEIIKSPDVNLTTSGLYKCVAECFNKITNCWDSSVIKRINYVLVNNQTRTIQVSLIPSWIIAVPIIGALAIIGAVIFLIIKYRGHRNSHPENQKNDQNSKPDDSESENLKQTKLNKENTTQDGSSTLL